MVIDTAEWIRRAKLIWGSKYSYLQTIYTAMDKPIIIGCQKHGFVTIDKALKHVKLDTKSKTASGCPECWKENPKSRPMTLEEFIERAIEIWGLDYLYSGVIYKNSYTPIKIYCTIHEKYFSKIPSNHIKNERPQGCPDCSSEKLRQYYNNKKVGKDKFKERAILINDKKYNYDLVEDFYEIRTKVSIECNICKHIFMQHAHHHLSGRQCPFCAGKHITNEEYINKLIIMHANRYNFDEVKYTTSRNTVNFICIEHNIKCTQVASHMTSKRSIQASNGCELCLKNQKSKGEKCILKFLEDNKIKYVAQFKINKSIWDIKNDHLIGYDPKKESEEQIKQIKNKPFDFYVFDHYSKSPLMIEFDGEQHEKPIEFFGGEEQFKKQQLSDKIKTDYCESNNIELIRISYKDYKKIEIILSKHLL